MALWKTNYFHSKRDMVDYLNGAIISKAIAPAGGFVVDGLTLIIDIGGGDVTVTFSAALGRAWTMDEIVVKINASLTGLASKLLVSQDHAQYNPARSQLKLDRDGTLTVRGTGTANSVFGFDGPATPANDTVSVEFADTDVQSIQQQHDEQDAWLVTTYA